MRIIAGTRRGLKLNTLEGDDTRPTLDRVKEALFSMLLPYLPSAKVLDLFAGSGALGLEALSRGAESAVFVDNSPSAMAIVKENASHARFEDEVSFFNTTFSDFLKKNTEKYDIIFLDPPYRGDFYESALKELYERNALAEGAVVVVEWDSGAEMPTIPACYNVLKERKYGRVMITLVSASL